MGSGGRSGARSTGGPMGGRSRQRSGARGWSAAGRRPGYFTRRTAQAWLRDVLDQAERGTLAAMVRTGRTFADAAYEYLRYLAEDRQRKPSTVRGRVEKPRLASPAAIDVFSPEEVHALVRAAACEENRGVRHRLGADGA
jgi:hypothetical protein